MTHEAKESAHGDPEQSGTDLIGMIKKIQQHLVFLERKIDALIQQQPSGPRRENSFSKSRRPFGHSHGGHRREKPEHGFRSDGMPRQDRRFGQSGDSRVRTFFPKKKRFFRHDEG